MKGRILIIDDEEDLCEIIQFNLNSEGFYTDIAFSAEEALKKDLKSFDLMLVDVMMEKMSGFKFAQKVRNDLNINVPLIFITAKDTENDLLTGYSIGGDDYIKKPFSLNEVIARVKAMIKRTKSEKETQKLILFEDMELNFDNKTLKIDNKEVKLTKKEFEILALFLQDNDKIHSRESIINKIWEEDTFVSNRTVDVHIARLRKKIGKYGKLIKSRSGFGYSFFKTH